METAAWVVGMEDDGIAMGLDIFFNEALSDRTVLIYSQVESPQFAQSKFFSTPFCQQRTYVFLVFSRRWVSFSLIMAQGMFRASPTPSKGSVTLSIGSLHQQTLTMRP
jgi:hypothetical protein